MAAEWISCHCHCFSWMKKKLLYCISKSKVSRLCGSRKRREGEIENNWAPNERDDYSVVWCPYLLVERLTWLSLVTRLLILSPWRTKTFENMKGILKYTCQEIYMVHCWNPSENADMLSVFQVSCNERSSLPRFQRLTSVLFSSALRYEPRMMGSRNPNGCVIHNALEKITGLHWTWRRTSFREHGGDRWSIERDVPCNLLFPGVYWLIK